MVLLFQKGPDAAGFSGVPLHAPGNPRVCIDPPPFGNQCTMHAVDAIRACLSLAGCAAVTCPAPEPYVNEDPARRGISGAVCQARSVPSAAAWLGGKDLEAGHGMCAPSGCATAFLVPVPSGALRPSAAEALEAAGALPALRARGGGARLVAVDAAAAAPADLFGLGPRVALLEGGDAGGAWLVREGDPALAQMAELLAPAGAPAWASLARALSVHLL